MESDFYLRYYVGHKGKFGHEFLEFEFRPDGKSGLWPPGARTGPGVGLMGRPGFRNVRGARRGRDCCLRLGSQRITPVSAPLVLSICRDFYLVTFLPRMLHSANTD